MKNDPNFQYPVDHRILSIMYVQLAQTIALMRSGVLQKKALMAELEMARMAMQKNGFDCATPAFNDLCQMYVDLPDNSN
ncbi:MAG: hypothetical protein HQL74_13750 [Magnetococcales bacterium]|nr:hypothetical protein [Magnetococcales bacterium]